MRVIARLVEDTWPACVDAVRTHAPPAFEVVLPHVTGPDVPGVAHGAYAGRAEREMVAAADGADLLVPARDGDRSRLGPHRLGPAVRFAVDHAPCPVPPVWPEPAPHLGMIPPPPPRHHH
ncbi:universal stress protein [Streptomyces sp. NPDC001450]